MPLPEDVIKTLDANIVNLVVALNEFAGVETIGSCGGHENPTRAQWEAGTWYVKFYISKNKTGWLVLEFLSWAINNSYRRDHHVLLLPVSAPPYLNTPGKMLAYALEGYDGENPEELAEFLNDVRPYFKPTVRNKL